MKLACSCHVLRQTLLYPTFVSCNLLKLTCRRIHTVRSVVVVTQLERGGALSSRHRSNALEICNSRPSSVTIFSQKRLFGQFWPLKPGASCVVRSTLGLVQRGRSLQSWSMLMASAEERKDSKPQSRAKEHTHGSVLMDMIKSQDQQPKELTVGAKGMAFQLLQQCRRAWV